MNAIETLQSQNKNFIFRGVAEALPCSAMPDPDSALWANQTFQTAPVDFKPTISNALHCKVRHGRLFVLDKTKKLLSFDAETGAETSGWQATSISGPEAHLDAVTDSCVLVRSPSNVYVIDIATGKTIVTIGQNARGVWGWQRSLLSDLSPGNNEDVFRYTNVGGPEKNLSLVPGPHDKQRHAQPTVLPLREGFVILSRHGKLYRFGHNEDTPTPLVDDTEVDAVVVGARYVAALMQKPVGEVRLWKRDKLEEEPIRVHLDTEPSLGWIGVFQDKLLWIDDTRTLHLAQAESPHVSVATTQYARQGEFTEAPLLMPFGGKAAVIRSYEERMARKYAMIEVSESSLEPAKSITGASPGVNDEMSVHFCGGSLYLCNATTGKLSRFQVL